MKQAIFILTIVLALAAGRIAFAEDVKVVTYYPTPDTEYKELEVKDSVYLATEGGNVVIGKNDTDLTGDGNLDVQGKMVVDSGVLKTAGELKLARLPTDPTLDEEGLIWIHET